MTDFSYLNHYIAGRWTQKEHALFVKGLELYNKQWKLIAELVKTRSVVQVRTHAQKYFIRLQKHNKNIDANYSMDSENFTSIESGYKVW